jgi:cyanate permease
MELLFVTVIGAGLGALVRYTLPQRGTYGALLLPAAAAAVTAAVWVGLVWVGLTFDGTWIWVFSLFAGGAAALVLALVLPRRRVAEDAQRLAQLSGGRA